jgi:hypothetical protein
MVAILDVYFTQKNSFNPDQDQLIKVDDKSSRLYAQGQIIRCQIFIIKNTDSEIGYVSLWLYIPLYLYQQLLVNSKQTKLLTSIPKKHFRQILIVIFVYI